MLNTFTIYVLISFGRYAVDGPPVRFAAETHAKLGNYAAR